jgi:hypothetical protein
MLSAGKLILQTNFQQKIAPANFCRDRAGCIINGFSPAVNQLFENKTKKKKS